MSEIDHSFQAIFEAQEDLCQSLEERQEENIQWWMEL